MTLRIGILGCGRIAGYFHAPILGSIAGAAVTALADPVPENRARVAGHAPGAVHYADWRLPIALGQIDAAVVCLPPALHAEAAVAAFGAGCHVYVEKPLSLTMDEGRAMAAAWRAAGTVGMIGLNYRFHPLVADARRRIAASEIGAVRAVRTLFTSERRPLPDWKLRAGGGGDALADLGTHDLDLAPFLTGARVLPESLRCDSQDGPDGSFAMVGGRLETGAFLSVTVGQTTGHSVHRIEILGERGHLTVDLSDAAPRPVERPEGRAARAVRLLRGAADLSPRRLLRAPNPAVSFAAALRAFVDAAATGKQVSPDLDDGLAAQALVLAAGGQTLPTGKEALRE